MSPAAGPKIEAFWTAYGKAAAAGTVEAGNTDQSKMLQRWFEAGWEAANRQPNGSQAAPKRRRRRRTRTQEPTP